MMVITDEEMQEHFTTHAWESLIPASFQDTLYLPSLKISVTAGSFVTYSMLQGISTASPSRRNVGRIVEVVTSKDLIDGYETNPVINALIPEAIGNDIRVHFAKVNIFKDRQMLCDTMFPVDDDEHGMHAGWQRIVQLDKCAWIPSHQINGLAFVALENKKDAIMRDDCQGMGDFFVAKYRMGGDGKVSTIPQHACPPFAGHIAGFDNTWTTDFCELIFRSLLQIRREVQRILCRVAQSQGDFAVRTAKVQLPNCSWFFIKKSMETKGIYSTSGVRYSQPRSVLSWGLAFYSRPYTGYFDVLRFDTKKKLCAFRALFGTMSGHGVRKKRPKYSDGHSRLCLNDVLNVVVGRDFSGADDDNADDNSSASGSQHFQRFGVSDDGIDLSYDSSDGFLQIVVRYRKVVVTDASLPTLIGVGVGALHDVEAAHVRTTTSSSSAGMGNIAAGMEFIDGLHVMRVQEVCSSEIRAKTIYRIDSATRATTKVTASEVIIYNDIAYVNRQIQQMLE